MRRLFPVIASLILASGMAGGQDTHDCSVVERSEDEVTLRVKSWDPVAALGSTLASRYGVRVSVEAPKWEFPGDAEDVAVADPKFSEEHDHIHFPVMRRHAIEVRFLVTANGYPSDLSALLHQVAEAANRDMPYQYRLDIDGADYALVPTRTRNVRGELETVEPLLDHKVTIPVETRSIIQHANLLARELSEQTGTRIGCCQSIVAGVPWGMAEITFGAKNQRARDVLRALMVAEHTETLRSARQHPDYDRWAVRCLGSGEAYCFIEVEGRRSARCP